MRQTEVREREECEGEREGGRGGRDEKEGKREKQKEREREREREGERESPLSPSHSTEWTEQRHSVILLETETPAAFCLNPNPSTPDSQ